MEVITKSLTQEECQSAAHAALQLRSALQAIPSGSTGLTIGGNSESIEIPVSTLRLFHDLLTLVATGNPVSIKALPTRLSIQQAANILGCSRPYLIKLLEEVHSRPYVKVGKHRRLQREDVLRYKRQMKADQRRSIVALMEMDDDAGLYDV